MEKKDEYLHYCQDPSTRKFILCNISNPAEIPSWKFDIPYDSDYLLNSAQIGNVIYFSGGGARATDRSPDQFYHSAQKVTIESAMKPIIEKIASMNIPKANHAMIAVSNQYLYVAGGTNQTGDISTCEEYNVATNKWKEIASLNEKKKWVSICEIKNQFIYAFGGSISLSTTSTDTIECLDVTKLSAKLWQVVKILQGKEHWTAKFFIGAVSLPNDCLLLFGGEFKGKMYDTCFTFNPSTREITIEKPLLVPDAFYRTKAGKKDGKILIVGGGAEHLHKYDMLEKKWDAARKTVWYPEQGFAVKSETI